MNLLLLGATTDGFPIALAAYAGLALLYLVLWRYLSKTATPTENPAPRRFCLAVAVLMVALGLGKEFQLGDRAVDVVRHLAQANGWYDERRVYQFWFILGVMFLGILGAAFVTYRHSQKIANNLPLFIALTSLVIFKVVQACSLHQIDALLATRIGIFTASRWIELTLLTIIAGIGIQKLMRLRTRATGTRR